MTARLSATVQRNVRILAETLWRKMAAVVPSRSAANSKPGERSFDRNVPSPLAKLRFARLAGEGPGGGSHSRRCYVGRPTRLRSSSFAAARPRPSPARAGEGARLSARRCLSTSQTAMTLLFSLLGAKRLWRVSSEAPTAVSPLPLAGEGQGGGSHTCQRHVGRPHPGPPHCAAAPLEGGGTSVRASHLLHVKQPRHPRNQTS